MWRLSSTREWWNPFTFRVAKILCILNWTSSSVEYVLCSSKKKMGFATQEGFFYLSPSLSLVRLQFESLMMAREKRNHIAGNYKTNKKYVIIYFNSNIIKFRFDGTSFWAHTLIYQGNRHNAFSLFSQTSTARRTNGFHDDAHDNLELSYSISAAASCRVGGVRRFHQNENSIFHHELFAAYIINYLSCDKNS